MKKVFIERCYNCGYDKHVEIAHIQSVNSFSGDITLDIINHPSNLIHLCPNCHWEFDHGLLDIINIPVPLAQR